MKQFVYLALDVPLLRGARGVLFEVRCVKDEARSAICELRVRTRIEEIRKIEEIEICDLRSTILASGRF